MEQLREVIRKKYVLDREMAAWQWEKQKLEEDVPQKTWALREAKVKLAEYEGGLRGFFDKFSGKREEKVEQLSRQVRTAAADLEYAKQQLEQAKAAVADLEQAAKELPTRQALFEQYPDSDYLKQQDALLCAERMLRLLRQNEHFLIEAREWAENRNAEYVGHPYGTGYDKTVALNKGADCAREIFLLLSQLQENEIYLQIHGYFQNPDGFIAGAARQYGQLDRINYALRAVREAMAMAQELILQLKDG